MSFGDTISHRSLLYGVYDGGDINIVHINIDFLNETCFMKFYFLEFCLDWLIFLQNDLKRSGLHCDCLCIKI